MRRQPLSRQGPPAESGVSEIGLPRHELRLHRKRMAATITSRVTLLTHPRCGQPVPADAPAGLCSGRPAAGAFSEAVQVCAAKATLRLLIRGRVPLFNSAWRQSMARHAGRPARARSELSVCRGPRGTLGMAVGGLGWNLILAHGGRVWREGDACCVMRKT